MNIRKSDIRGETLAETIVALSILAIVITVASTIMVNSMRNLSVAKQRVVAVNIAREGIEAMRNIRDTNWLLYSDRRRQCWNQDPEFDCDPPSPIVPGIYVVYKSADGSWQLEAADKDLNADDNFDTVTDETDGDDNFENDPDKDLIKLSLVDIDDSVNSDGEGDSEDDPDMFNHYDGISDRFGTFARNTTFTRYIIVEYLENQPDPATDPSADVAPQESINTKSEWTDAANDPDLLNRMRLTSVVGWTRGGIAFSVELKTIITDHLGRKDLSS